MPQSALTSTFRLNGALLLLATCAGLGVANVYYLQPGLSLVQSEFGVSPERVGWVPTLTQIGYALGMLLLAPLGDVVPRRRLILVKTVLLVLAPAGGGYLPGLGWLVIASIAVGLAGQHRPGFRADRRPTGPRRTARPGRRHRDDRVAQRHPAVAHPGRLGRRVLLAGGPCSSWRLA